MIPRNKIMSVVDEFEKDTIFEIQWTTDTIIFAQKCEDGWMVIESKNPSDKRWVFVDKHQQALTNGENMGRAGADAKYIISHGVRIDW